MHYIIRLDTIDKVKDFCNAAEKVNADITIRQGEYEVLARSIMGVFSLNLLNDLELIIGGETKVKDIGEFINTIENMGLIIRYINKLKEDSNENL